MRFKTVLSTAFLFPCVLLAQQSPKLDASGVWLGTLVAGPQSLRIQLRLQTGADGTVGCALDSIDQHAFGIACTLAVKGDHLLVEIPGVGGRWTGQIAQDGLTLTGAWRQASELPLTFKRQSTAISQPLAPQP